MRKIGLVMVVPALALSLVACGDSGDSGDNGDGSSGGVEIHATLDDFDIKLDETSAAAGPVAFEVDNEGPSTHEFVVVKTDLAPDKLPTDENGDVDEEGDGITVVDEIEDIEDGDSSKLEVDLEAGDYALFCNLPGHYRLGMHAALTVS
jgi:uncharacterized cupredoxin-like copper-binding protein